MKRFILALALFVSPAAAQTINNLVPGVAVQDTDLFPAWQGANPAHRVSGLQLKTYIGGGGANPIGPAGGDLTGTYPNPTLLATVNGAPGTFGSATSCVTATVNGKGLITAMSAATCTPAIGSVTGLSAGVATALGTNIGAPGSIVVNGGALGTPASGILGIGITVQAGNVTWTGTIPGGALAPINLASSGNGGVTGTLPIANNCPGSTGASSTTFLRGDCTWATPSGAGNVSTTGTPASGNLAFFSGGTTITNGNLSGDVTTAGTGATTLATVNSNTGPFGSATQCVTVTNNAKGLTTAVSATTCTPAIGSVTGLGTGVAAALGNALNATGGVLGVGATAGGYLTGTYPNPTVTKVSGVTNGSNAAAGDVGEYVSSQVLVGSAVALTSGTAANITSISLTAGDWDVCGTVVTNPAGTTVTSLVLGWISTTSATLPTIPNNGSWLQLPTGSAAGLVAGSSVGCVRESLSATTTVYLSIQTNFNTSTESAYGFIGARRMR